MSETEGTKAPCPRIIIDVSDNDTVVCMASVFTAQPGMQTAEVVMPILPELLGIAHEAWASAGSLANLAKAMDEEISLSVFLVTGVLRPGDMFVRRVRGLVCAPGAPRTLHEGLVVILNNPATGLTAGVILFDPEGLTLTEAAFQTAPPARASHAFRWFARRLRLGGRRFFLASKEKRRSLVRNAARAPRRGARDR